MGERVGGGTVACHHCATLDELQRRAEQGSDGASLARIGYLRERHQDGVCLALGVESWGPVGWFR